MDNPLESLVRLFVCAKISDFLNKSPSEQHQFCTGFLQNKSNFQARKGHNSVNNTSFCRLQADIESTRAALSADMHLEPLDPLTMAQGDEMPLVPKSHREKIVK
jgi:hypothetical protein